jgi:hypothetical protein
VSATAYFMNPASSSGALGVMHKHRGLKMALPQAGMLRPSDDSSDSAQHSTAQHSAAPQHRVSTQRHDSRERTGTGG